MRHLNEHQGYHAPARGADGEKHRPDSVVVLRVDSLAARRPVRMDTAYVAITETRDVPAAERPDSAAMANAPRTPAIKDTVGARGTGKRVAAAGRGGRGTARAVALERLPAGNAAGTPPAGGPPAGRGAGGGGGGGRGGAATKVYMTGQTRPVYMEVRDRFSAVRKEAIPAAYVFGSQYGKVVELMRRWWESTVREDVGAARTGATAHFMVDSVDAFALFRRALRHAPRRDLDGAGDRYDPGRVVRRLEQPPLRHAGCVPARASRPEDGYVGVHELLRCRDRSGARCRAQ